MYWFYTSFYLFNLTMKYSKWSRADWDSVIQQTFHLSRNTLYFSGQSMAFEPEVDFAFNDTSFYL